MENILLLDQRQRIVKPIQREEKRIKALNPEFISRIYKEDMCDSNLEAYKILVLDSNNCIIAKVDVSRYECEDTEPTPRDVIQAAIKYNSRSIIIMQNRPHGDPLPNKKDRELTKRLVESSKLMGLKTIDHIIFGRERYFSFREKHLI